MLDYKDVTLVPRNLSTLATRSEADTSIEMFGHKYDLPLIASPMPDVCDSWMAHQLAHHNILGIVHRFMPVNMQHIGGDGSVLAAAVGASEKDIKERFEILYKKGCRIFCIDTANGFNVKIADAVKLLRNLDATQGDGPPIYIIAGNVASKEGYAYLDSIGVDAVRCGIAGGCFTESMEVVTKEGLKKINEVSVGEEVLSHNGSYNKVTSVFMFDKKDTLLKINDIECTPNHEFYVVSKEDTDKVTEENVSQYAKWIQAKDLDDNYLLVELDF